METMPLGGLGKNLICSGKTAAGRCTNLAGSNGAAGEKSGIA